MWSPRLADLSTVCIPHATESLALARCCGISRVKKRVMYELVRLPGYGQNDRDGDGGGGVDASWEGDADDEEGGERDLFGEMGTTNGRGKRKVRRHVKLANADKDALTRAREHLTSLWIMTTGYVAKDFMYCPNTTSDGGNDATTPPDANPANPTSQNDAPCTTTTPGLPLAHMRLVHESGLMEEYAFDPVCGFQALMDAPWAGAGFCKGCVDRRKRAWQGAREKAWENLGIWFGLSTVEDGDGE